MEEEEMPLLAQDSDNGDDPDNTLPGILQDELLLDIEANENSTISAIENATPKLRTSSLMQIIAVLAIGLFASNLDTFLVIATHPEIASEFNALKDSSWIFVSFLLAGAATQVLYAKLSDVYGRMYILVFCYALFGIGCGLSRSLWQVVLGRILSGSGGSGMASLVLVLTTDLIPLQDVAAWLGYVNIISTTARSLGGPVGGLLADQVGWRWSFLGQVPFFIVAILASLIVIPNTKAPATDSDDVGLSIKSVLSRLDLSGSLLLGLAILLIMLPLEIGGQRVAWTHPFIYGLFAAGFATLGLFIVNEARWAKEPAIPLTLLGDRDIIASYMVICSITAAQTSLLYFIPIYFQVTAGVSNTVAGLHLVPSVVGNTIGGLVAGSLIKRTGGYKTLVLASSVLISLGSLLLLLRWSGHTTWWESMYIVPCGFANGMGWPAVIISITAVVEPSHRAVVSSGLQLVTPVAMILGVAASSAVMLGVLQKSLAKKLTEIGLDDEIRDKVASFPYAHRSLPRCSSPVERSFKTRRPMLGISKSFRDKLRKVLYLGTVLAMALMGLIGGLFLRQRNLERHNG
ncbi:MFS general substrate transporter [Xylariaceae sp. FL0255]|nr:MFS general substrate transporter [Xylariaceae sp. FL0255]